jgi:hypothetical protein
MKLHEVREQLAETPPDQIQALLAHSKALSKWHIAYAQSLARVLREYRRTSEVQH